MARPGRPPKPHDEQTEVVRVRLPRWVRRVLEAHGEVGAILRQQAEALASLLNPDEAPGDPEKK